MSPVVPSSEEGDTSFIIHFELPAVMRVAQARLRVRKSSEDDLFDAAIEMVKAFCEEYEEVFVDLDVDSNINNLQRFRQDAMREVDSWRGKLKDAEEWHAKSDRAVDQLSKMRDAYYKEILVLREQLFRKDKEGDEFEPDEGALHFSPNDFKLEQAEAEAMAKAKEKIALAEKECEARIRTAADEHEAEVASVKEQLATTKMLLSLKEQMITKFKQEREVFEQEKSEFLVEKQEQARALSEQEAANQQEMERLNEEARKYQEELEAAMEARAKAVEEAKAQAAAQAAAQVQSKAEERPSFEVRSANGDEDMHDARATVSSERSDKRHPDATSKEMTKSASEAAAEFLGIFNEDWAGQPSAHGQPRREEDSESDHDGDGDEKVPADAKPVGQAVGSKKAVGRLKRRAVKKVDMGIMTELQGECVPKAGAGCYKGVNRGTDAMPYQAAFVKVKHTSRATQSQIDGRMIDKAINFYDEQAESNWNDLVNLDDDEEEEEEPEPSEPEEAEAASVDEAVGSDTPSVVSDQSDRNEPFRLPARFKTFADFGAWERTDDLILPDTGGSWRPRNVLTTSIEVQCSMGKPDSAEVEIQVDTMNAEMILAPLAESWPAEQDNNVEEIPHDEQVAQLQKVVAMAHQIQDRLPELRRRTVILAEAKAQGPCDKELRLMDQVFRLHMTPTPEDKHQRDHDPPPLDKNRIHEFLREHGVEANGEPIRKEGSGSSNDRVSSKEQKRPQRMGVVRSKIKKPGRTAEMGEYVLSEPSDEEGDQDVGPLRRPKATTVQRSNVVNQTALIANRVKRQTFDEHENKVKRLTSLGSEGSQEDAETSKRSSAPDRAGMLGEASEEAVDLGKELSVGVALSVRSRSTFDRASETPMMGRQESIKHHRSRFKNDGGGMDLTKELSTRSRTTFDNSGQGPSAAANASPFGIMSFSPATSSRDPGAPGDGGDHHRAIPPTTERPQTQGGIPLRGGRTLRAAHQKAMQNPKGHDRDSFDMQGEEEWLSQNSVGNRDSANGPLMSPRKSDMSYGSMMSSRKSDLSVGGGGSRRRVNSFDSDDEVLDKYLLEDGLDGGDHHGAVSPPPSKMASGAGMNAAKTRRGGSECDSLTVSASLQQQSSTGEPPSPRRASCPEPRHGGQDAPQVLSLPSVHGSQAGSDDLDGQKPAKSPHGLMAPQGGSRPEKSPGRPSMIHTGSNVSPKGPLAAPSPPSRMGSRSPAPMRDNQKAGADGSASSSGGFMTNMVTNALSLPKTLSSRQPSHDSEASAHSGSKGKSTRPATKGSTGPLK